MSFGAKCVWSAGRTIFVGLLVAGLIVSCAPQEQPGEEEAAEGGAPAGAEAEEQAAAEAPGEPRVYFVDPQDGDTVGTLVTLEFGAENFTIEPVGEGEIHEGAGHYHIGLDTDCLPPGEVIPQADPWIHFGDGSSEIEMQLTPGEHRLCLQVGDGEHRTLEGAGMSELITVTVVEEDEAASSMED